MSAPDRGQSEETAEHAFLPGDEDVFDAGDQPTPIGIRHEDHVDYLQSGHLHHLRQDGVVEEHSIPISDSNPTGDDAPHQASRHSSDHRHGPGCGQPLVPHGGHLDYLVDGRLHHPRGDHCDDHGSVEAVDEPTR
jgi:hypothetical protein